MLNLNKPKRLASYEKMVQSSITSKVLSYLVNQDIQPNYDEYLALNTALQSGDEPMDQVMQWMLQNPKLHRKYFETALYEGLDKLPHNIPELTDFFHLVEQKPVWYEQHKIDAAIKFTYRLGINNGLILRDLSLMTGYMYPGFNQPLILTGALKKQAGTRLAETTKWWVDITEPDGFTRFGKGFTSTIYVRFIHALVRHQLRKSEKWDAETWGLPINQYDQAMTNIAFSGVVLIGIRALGIFPNKQEVDSFLHFWKYAGWLMGIEEKWLVDQERDGWKLIYWMQFAHPKSDASSISLGSSLSKEPFERQYRYLRTFQQKLAYKQHLEITQFFIGRKKMKSLGLDAQSASWFAYYLILRNLTLYTSAKYIAPINQFLERNGRQLQRTGLSLYRKQSQQLASMHQ
ncbi:oxygenase MpaB family protein [Acinetobacter haemolyticus]|uniref:oxygenase MpaB family protein n=1 Tax=Acinetobacter haemolyticus TaxID=29430 RepID=UPI0002E5B998|nr:oxygenase MpaB family protein [Acinetobacter haemolyticus]WPO67218.1 oxygenase MpaB family protein [Acinetobacter haemolyticus]